MDKQAIVVTLEDINMAHQYAHCFWSAEGNLEQSLAEDFAAVRIAATEAATIAERSAVLAMLRDEAKKDTGLEDHILAWAAVQIEEGRHLTIRAQPGRGGDDHVSEARQMVDDKGGDNGR